MKMFCALLKWRKEERMTSVRLSKGEAIVEGAETVKERTMNRTEKGLRFAG